MKQLSALILTLSLALTGCASLQGFGTGVSLATRSITNPVTINDVYAVEASLRIAVGGLQAYKQSCIAGIADVRCRANIAAVQHYTIQAAPYLIQLRTFVRNNDQINAIVVYNELIALVTQAKSTAASFGINIGG